MSKSKIVLDPITKAKVEKLKSWRDKSEWKEYKQELSLIIRLVERGERRLK